MDAFKNLVKVTVSTGYDASATSIVLSSGDGAKLAAAPFNGSWYNATDYGSPDDDPNAEIIRVTAISTDTLTVTRAQEGSSASTKNTGGKTYKMIFGLTAKTLNTDIMPQVLTTRGDLVRRGASAAERVALGVFGDRLISDGTDAIWKSPQNFYYFFDDFNGLSGSTGPNDLTWTNANNSIGTGTADHPGVGVYTTTTSSSGTGSCSKAATSILFGGGKLIFRCSIKLSALSDGTDTYILRAGFIDSTTAPVDGAWIEYTHSANSGKFTGKTSNNSTVTTVNGNVTTDTNWTYLDVVVAADGSSVEFFANGTSLGTSSTNIPTGAGRETGFGISITKSAGTTARTFSVDYVLVTQNLTNAR